MERPTYKVFHNFLQQIRDMFFDQKCFFREIKGRGFDGTLSYKMILSQAVCDNIFEILVMDALITAYERQKKTNL